MVNVKIKYFDDNIENVISVNGKTGKVVLSASDVNAI